LKAKRIRRYASLPAKKHGGEKKKGGERESERGKKEGFLDLGTGRGVPFRGEGGISEDIWDEKRKGTPWVD